MKWLFLFCALSASAQIARLPLPIVSSKKVAAGCVSDYSNAGGTGNRSGSITVSASGGLFGAGTGAKFVDGVTSAATDCYFNAITVDSSVFFYFDFGANRVITEAKFYQQDTSSHGTWKWQGSTDGGSWTDIGSGFTFGGAATQTQTSLSANITAYRYYMLRGVSGTTSDSPYLYEMEFKICPP